jgi:hypothetical protein
VPANLTPQYHAAEQRFREARSTEEKIEALEEMLAVMPKHKGTDKLKADLRRRMAKLQEEEGRAGKGRRGVDPYHIKREGAGQVALYGLPNAGKSSLLSALTHAVSPVADYPFTTHQPVVGMMPFEDVQIQLVDLPPLMDEGSRDWLPRVLRRADALALVLDATEDAATQASLLEEGLREMGLSLRGRGEPPEETGRDRVKAFLICLTKVDLAPDLKGPLEDLAPWPAPAVLVSALDTPSLEDFRRASFASLELIRVYTKAPHEKPVKRNPLILPRGATVEDAARGIHKDFAQNLKFARIWGEGFFEGQMVGRDQVLHDGAVVEFHA